MLDPSTRRSRQRNRWIVYIFLLGTAAISLLFEAEYTIHEIVGLCFVPFLVIHLIQRRDYVTALLRQLLKFHKFLSSIYRKALNDLFLAFLTLGMLVSGLWDWRLGHPTKIRWHAIFGVLLAFDLMIHSLRRWRKITWKVEQPPSS
jgi:hypothetical protein